MSMPTSDLRAAVLLTGLLLAGCDGGGVPGGAGDNRTATSSGPASAPVDDGHVDCAIGGGAQWTRDCLIEQQGDMLTIRHADGGFRRFRIVTDGRGVVPADGAEAAVVRVDGDRWIAVTVGQDLYRLPATIAPAKR